MAHKKNWEMFFEVETSNPVWFFGHYNSLYNQCKFEELERTYYSIYASELKPFKATIKFSYFDKSYAVFDDVNIKDRFYIVYLTDLKDFMNLLVNGQITGTFEYVNKNGNIGIRYINK